MLGVTRQSIDRRNLCKHFICGAAAFSFDCSVCAASPALQGCGLNLGVSAGGLRKRLLTSSGDSILDDLCQAEASQLSQYFEISPELSFLDDSDGANAYAIPPEKPGAPALVALGINLIKRMGVTGRNVFPLIGVMAHEWAHVAQFERGIDTDWVIKWELQADYLAGWYLMKTRGQDRDVVDNIANVFSGLGDTVFTAPDHHGTPQQRSANILDGAGMYEVETIDGKRRPYDGQIAPAETFDAAFERSMK